MPGGSSFRKRAFLSMHTRIIGGSSETEVKELTVIPYGFSSPNSRVTTVTPEGKRLDADRKAMGDTEPGGNSFASSSCKTLFAATFSVSRGGRRRQPLTGGKPFGKLRKAHFSLANRLFLFAEAKADQLRALLRVREKTGTRHARNTRCFDQSAHKLDVISITELRNVGHYVIRAFRAKAA